MWRWIETPGTISNVRLISHIAPVATSSYYLHNSIQRRSSARAINNIITQKGGQGRLKTSPALPGPPFWVFHMVTFQNKVHYSRDLETSVMGICLLEPQGIFKIKSILAPEMFYYEEAQITYTGLLEMANQAIPIDLITAHDYFYRYKNLPHIKKHETAYFLSRLTNEVVSSAHLITWAKILKAMWTARELARVKTDSVHHLQQATKRLTQPIKSANNKQYRFLLTYVDKQHLKPHLSKLGARVIAGKTPHKIRVSSPLLVLLMSIIEPQYTWTVSENADEHLTNDQCRLRMPANALFDGTNWIDKSQKIPIGWL